MKYVLKKKQSSNNADIIRVWNDIEQYVSYEEAQRLVNDAAEEIRWRTNGKKAGYAWSGGKDSIALEVVCELAGVKPCVLGISSPLEIPAFLVWVEQNKPEGLEVWDAKIGLDFLKAHPEMLFPRNSANTARWFALIQHKAQAWFFKTHELDIICLGRRVQDGNYIGRGTNMYTDGKGVTRYSPIAHWKHEDVLAVIHYFKNRNIPPIYDYPNGWVYGTGVWAARQTTMEVQEIWRELYGIDKSIVEYAATEIESAKDFLQVI